MRSRRTVLTALMVAFAILWLLPAVWVFVTSLKPTANIVRLPPEWIPWPATLDHYGEVLFSSSRTRASVAPSSTALSCQEARWSWSS